MSRILVIDDDALVRRLIQRLLQDQGRDVLLAERGEDGLQQVENETCDLVIVDIFMPGMNGFETIKRIRRLRPTLPIIAMSGFSAGRDAPDFVAMATKLGADYGLVKPFRPAELLACVQACLQDVGRVPGTAMPRAGLD